MPVIVALALGLAVTPVAARVARWAGIVDRPGPLKVHEAPVPYLGGVAIFLAALPWLVGRPGLLVPLGAALVLGVLDDARGLAPRLRLATEAAIGGAVALAVDSALPDAVHAIAVPLAVVVLINGVNVLDGLDGLAGGVALAGLLGLAATTVGDERSVALALAGGTVGFLWFNRAPARIYLGDGGSYLLGTALAALLVASWSDGRPAGAGIGAGLAVALPVGELTVAVIRRAIARRPLLQGDREHGYDRLVARGWSVPAAACACVAGAAALAAVGALLAVTA